jgi:hypothetical protein
MLTAIGLNAALLSAVKLLKLSMLGSFALLVIGGGLWLGAVVLYVRYRGYSQNVTMPYVILVQDIGGISARGPLFTLRLRRSPIPGMKVLTMYIAPEIRRSFLAEFNDVFPGLLPLEYRAAIDRMSATLDVEREFIWVSTPRAQKPPR